MESYFVYIIENSTKILYKGFTTNIKQRLIYHNSNKSRFTAYKGPWKLVFLRKFYSKREAIQYEKMLKRQNRKYLDWLIHSDRNQL